MPTPTISPDHEAAEIARLRAEEKKHLAEARELSRPVVRRPAFWGALIPGLAAVVAASVAFNSELWDAREAAAKAETKFAAATLKEINAQADKISAEKERLEAQKIRVTYDLDLAKANFDAANAKFKEETKLLEENFAAREIELGEQEAELEQSTLALENELESLEKRETALNADLENLEKEKASLGVERDALLAANAQIEQKNKDLEAARLGLEKELAALELKLENAGVESSIDRLLASTDFDDFETRHSALRIEGKEAEDRQAATEIIFSRADEVQDLWLKTALLGAGLSVAKTKNPDRFEMFLATGAAALEQPSKSSVAFWDALILRSFDWETPRDTLRICKVIQKGFPSASEQERGASYMSGTLNQCAANDRGRDLSDEQRLEIIEPHLEFVVSRFKSSTLQQLDQESLFYFRGVDLISTANPEVSDIVMAAWLAAVDFELDELRAEWLEKYVETGFNMGVPSKLGSVAIEDWKAFWDQSKSEFDSEILLAKLQEQ